MRFRFLPLFHCWCCFGAKPWELFQRYGKSRWWELPLCQLLLHTKFSCKTSCNYFSELSLVSHKWRDKVSQRVILEKCFFSNRDPFLDVAVRWSRLKCQTCLRLCDGWPWAPHPPSQPPALVCPFVFRILPRKHDTGHVIQSPASDWTAGLWSSQSGAWKPLWKDSWEQSQGNSDLHQVAHTDE